MRLVRTVLAFAIAISLAMLPIGTSAAGLAMSSDDMQPSMHMVGGAEMSMDDCCPGDMQGTSDADAYKCGMGFCCVGATVALGDVRALGFEFLAVTSSKIAIPSDQVVAFRGASPPFRPPRV